jgi:hypothetical protein
VRARKRPPSFDDMRPEYKPEKVLSNWRQMINMLPKMTEAEVSVALEKERQEGKRKDFVFRLGRRLASLKYDRSLKEFVDG